MDKWMDNKHTSHSHNTNVPKKKIKNPFGYVAKLNPLVPFSPPQCPS